MKINIDFWVMDLKLPTAQLIPRFWPKEYMHPCSTLFWMESETEMSKNSVNCQTNPFSVVRSILQMLSS